MNAELVIKLSVFVDKMGLDLASINGKDKEEIGTILLSQILKNLHKAENEFYELISSFKKISIEEAKKEDVVKLLKEFSEIGLKDFLV